MKKLINQNTIPFFFVEEDPHLSCEDYLCYIVSSRKSIDSPNLSMDMCAETIMGSLLKECNVFTEVDLPCPQKLPIPMPKGSIFYEGNSMVCVTKGMHRQLIHLLHNSFINAPYIQSGFFSSLEKCDSFSQAKKRCNDNPDIWMKYDKRNMQLHIGILADKFHEEKLVYLLNEIGVKQGKKFVFGWPVSHK